MRTTFIGVAAFVSLVTALPAHARDGSAAREGRSRIATQATVAPVIARAAAQPPTSNGRPCCVMAGGTAHDHLRR